MKKQKRSHYEVYQDAADEWRWRLRAKNGRIVADSGEGYSTKRKALTACRRLIEIVDGADEFCPQLITG